ncbi:MAG: hypothetical protein QNJ53_21465 [Pleurocapsa sp. MO_192.B19]|nr:hypothetical protein [Pleurocapsa sp. MO_192.B19]
MSVSSKIDDLRAIAPHTHFFVLAFQDMLRLTHRLICDAVLKEVALSFVQEDAGHEQWYLFDVEQLGCVRDVRWLFSPTHQPVRDFVYQLMSELLRASDDRVRIIFPLILEATGTVFFKHLVGLVQRSGYDQTLRYFATSHQEIEVNHTIYNDAEQAALNNIEFDENTYQQAIGLVHRCFDSFERFADHLEHHRRDWTDNK